MGAGSLGGAGVAVAGLEGGRKGALLCPEPLCPHSVPNAPTWSSGLDSGRLYQPQPPGTLQAHFLSETLSTVVCPLLHHPVAPWHSRWLALRFLPSELTLWSSSCMPD